MIFMIVITFESCNKTCSKIENTWFQLFQKKKYSSSRPKVFRKKFAEFAGKHLGWSLFLTWFTEQIQKQLSKSAL